MEHKVDFVGVIIILLLIFGFASIGFTLYKMDTSIKYMNEQKIDAMKKIIEAQH